MDHAIAQPDWTIIPVPLFLVDESLQLISANTAAERVFLLSDCTSFNTLLDQGSLTKAARMLQPDALTLHSVELNLRTKEGIRLFDVHPSWNSDGRGWLLCHPKHVELERIETMAGFISRQLKENQFYATAPSAPAVAPIRAKKPRTSDALTGIQNALELLELLRSDLIELHKEDFLDVIVQQLRSVTSQVED